MNKLPEAWYSLEGLTPSARRHSIGSAQAAYLKRFGAFPAFPRLFRVGNTIYIGYTLPIHEEPEEPDPPQPPEPATQEDPAPVQLTLGGIA